MSSKRKIGKKIYDIWDAFPTKALAKSYAKDFRKQGLGNAVVKDLGKKAGRLRYAIYVASKKRKRR